MRCGLQQIGQDRGVVLRSGKSYHYIGFDLLDEAGVLDFISRSLLLLPLVDGRYLGHRLLEAELALRVSGCERKPVPTVVEILQNDRIHGTID